MRSEPIFLSPDSVETDLSNTTHTETMALIPDLDLDLHDCPIFGEARKNVT